MVRALRPTSNGCPAPPNTTGMTQASQHSSRNAAGVATPAKSRHAARARFSRSSSRISTVTWGRCPPVSGNTVVSPWSATYPNTSARASAWRCPTGRVSSALSGAALASITEAISSYMAGSSNRADE